MTSATDAAPNRITSPTETTSTARISTEMKLPINVPTRVPWSAWLRATRTVSAPTPNTSPDAATAVRAGARLRLATPMAAMPLTGRARRGATTGGRMASSGSLRDARHAGASPARTASRVATGATTRVRTRGMSRPNAATAAAATPVPATPATTPTPASSETIATNTLARDHPRHMRVPISTRRARTEANAALARKNPQITRMRANSTTLLRSTASRNLTATPFSTHPSSSSSSGRPNLPAGSSMSMGRGDDPAVMSTASPVRLEMAAATFLMRSRERGSGPVTPATRTRMTLMGP
jgi:hypothetical protein